MKRIGLITYYGHNYGGMLQAYALQRYVKEQGYECKIISNEFLYTRSKEEIIKQQIRKLGSLLKNPVSYLKRRNTIRKYAEQNSGKNKSFSKFLKENIEIDDTGYETYEQYVNEPPQYDIYLCGSDQIWNPNLYCKNGFYFAGFAPDDRLKISYASSLGISSVTAEQAAFMKPHLDRLNLISTRETDGSAIVEQITGKKVRTVIDPTLLLNEAQWSEVASPPLFDEPYIFCYLFGERPYFERIKKQIREISGMKIVCIPYTARELTSDDTKVFEAGPAEFISLIKHAKLVLTDSFHATAFSINLRTPFLSLCRFDKTDQKGMNSRLHTILGAVGLTERLIDKSDSVAKEKLYAVDFDTAHIKLEQLRKEDGEFLKKALKSERG